MPVCTSCGASYEDQFQFCPYCGRAKPGPREPIRVDVVAREASSPLDCPVCGRADMVTKVSALVESGTVEIEGQVPVAHTVQDGDRLRTETAYEEYHATRQSALTKKLLPPPAPRRTYSRLVFLAPLVPFFMLCIASLACMMQAGASSDPVWLGIGILVFVGLLTAGAVRFFIEVDRPFKAQHAANLRRWKEARVRWGELYYCQRDDSVFVPQEGRAYPASEMLKAVYRADNGKKGT